MEKVYMCPYDIDALPKETLCNDGLNFSLNEVALLICNKAVPRDGRIYFEFTVTSYNAIQVIRNIPLYVGVHKEPSFGVLNADCCIGSIYYEEGKDFDIIDQYKAERDNEHRVPDKIHYRIPAITDAVGVLIDSTCNTITIYNEGHILYSFSPSHFNLNDDRYFPCIYTSAQAAIKGHINFGKAGIVNIPPKAYSIYGYYYRRISSVSTIDFKFNVVNDTPTINGTSIGFDLSMSSDHELGDTVPLYTVSRTAKYRDSTNLNFTIDHKDSSNYDDDGCIVASNKGIPYYTKVYLECRVKNGTLGKDVVGIPIAAGLANSQGTIMSKSFMMPLYHGKQYRYSYKEISDRVPYEHYIKNMLSPVAMDQEKIIGIGFDLENQSMSIYMDKILMCVIKTDAIKFKQSNDMMYFIIHDVGAFTGTISCSVNFGETQFEGVLPEGYMSLWDYYNHFYPIPIKNCPNIAFDFKALPYKTLKTKYLHFSFYVIGQDFDEGAFKKPGMNKLMKTFNTVSDQEAHLTGERSIIYLDDLISKNNNGYYPDDQFDEKGESKGINIEITGNWELSWDTFFDFTIPRFNMTHDLDFSMAAVQYLKHDLVFDVMVANYQSVVAGISISPVGVVTREAETASYKFGRSTYAEKGVDDFIDTQQYHLRLCATKYNATKKKREVVAYKDSDYQGFNDAIAAKDCDIMVEFNRCFVERTQDADGTEHFKTMDSTNKTSGALSPAFTRGSKTYTAIRIGKYPVNSSYMSMPNTTPLTGVTLDQMRSAARAKGQYVLDYATYCTLLMLMTVKYGSIDVRNTVGVGSATAMSSGRSDEILNNDGTATGNDAVESLWIENYWGNGAPKFVDAVMISGTNMDEVYMTNDIANMTSLNKSNLTKLSIPTIGVDANKILEHYIDYQKHAYNTLTAAQMNTYWTSVNGDTNVFGADATNYADYTSYAKAAKDAADSDAANALALTTTMYDKHTTDTELVDYEHTYTKKASDMSSTDLELFWPQLKNDRDITGSDAPNYSTYASYAAAVKAANDSDAANSAVLTTTMYDKHASSSKTFTTTVTATKKYSEMTDAEIESIWSTAKTNTNVFGTSTSSYATYAAYKAALVNTNSGYFDKHSISTRTFRVITDGAATTYKVIKDMTEDEIERYWNEAAYNGTEFVGTVCTTFPDILNIKGAVVHHASEYSTYTEYKNALYVFYSGKPTSELRVIVGDVIVVFKDATTAQLEKSWKTIRNYVDVFGTEAASYDTYSAFCDAVACHNFYYDKHILNNNVINYTTSSGTFPLDKLSNMSATEIEKVWKTVRTIEASFSNDATSKDTYSAFCSSIVNLLRSHNSKLIDYHFITSDSFGIGTSLTKMQVSGLSIDQLNQYWYLLRTKSCFVQGTYSSLVKVNIDASSSGSFTDYWSALTKDSTMISGDTHAKCTDTISVYTTNKKYVDATVEDLESVWSDIKNNDIVFKGASTYNTYTEYATAIANISMPVNTASLDKHATSSETATVTSTGTVTCSSATEAQLNAAWSTIRSDTDLFGTDATKYSSYTDYKAAVAAAQTKAATKASDTTYDKHASSSKSFSIQIVSNVAMNTIPTSDLEYNWMNSHSLRTKTGAFGTAATSYDTYAKYAKAVADAQAKAAVKASDTTYDKSATSTDIAILPVPAIRYITNKLKYLKKLAYDKDVPWALYPGELDTAVALTTNKTWSVATEDVDAYPREDQIVVVNGGDATDQTGLLYWDRVPTNFTGAQAYFMELVD